MDEAGVRQSQRARRVGDFKLEGMLFEGPGYQDWKATLAFHPAGISSLAHEVKASAKPPAENVTETQRKAS